MKLSLLQKTALPLSVAFLALASAQAQAAIIGTSGAITLVSPPAGTSLAEGNTETFFNIRIFAFDEEQDVTVPSSGYSPFAIDVRTITTGSTIENQGGFVNLSPGMVMSGSFSSHLLHFDPNENSLIDPVTLRGTITFDQDIVGIITETDSLNGSDFLGLDSVTYAPDGRRGLGWGLNDSAFGLEGITITGTRELSIDLTALKAIDQIRVITSGAPDDSVIVEQVPVPEPTSVLGLLALGTIGAGSQLLSKKKHK